MPKVELCLFLLSKDNHILLQINKECETQSYFTAGALLPNLDIETKQNKSKEEEKTKQKKEQTTPPQKKKKEKRKNLTPVKPASMVCSR